MQNSAMLPKILKPSPSTWRCFNHHCYLLSVLY